MTWWQIILIMLCGAMPCLIVAAVAAMAIVDQAKYAVDYGAVEARLKGIESIVNRLDSRVRQAERASYSGSAG